MNLIKISIVYLALLTLPMMAFAADAATSATAGSRPGGGDATATAAYSGDRGFARTDTRTGAVNVARGVAVGVDRDGIALSISGAVAPRNGPAIATTLNIGIERDGDVSTSTGVAVARSPISRSVTAGGSVGANRPASAIVCGATDPYGAVKVVSTAEHHRALRPVVIERRRNR